MPVFIEELTSAAVVSESLDGRRSLALTSTAEITAAVVERAAAVLASAAVVTATLAGTQYLEESVESSARIADQVEPRLSASAVSSAVVSAAVTFRHAAVVAESAHIIGSIAGTGNVAVVDLTSGARIADALRASTTALLASTAQVTGHFGPTKVTARETSAAAIAATVTPKGYSRVSLSSAGAVDDALGSVLRAQEALASTALVESFVRLSGAAAQQFWTNTKTTAGATWDHLPLNSLTAKDGVLYGAGAEGVHELAQTGDHEGAVTWDLMNFGSPQQKQIQAVYLSGTAGGAMTVRVATEDGAWEYDTHLAAATTKVVNHRATPGRGLKSSDYRITVKADHVFDIGDVSVLIAETKRRIGN